jgi:hypothetical protein
MQRTAAPVPTDTFMSAGWMRVHLKINDRQLTTAVARGRVRVLNNVGLYPTYSVDDMKAFLRDQRRSGEETSAKAPARKPKRATAK